MVVGELGVLVVLLGQPGGQDLLTDDLAEPFLAHSCSTHSADTPVRLDCIGCIVETGANGSVVLIASAVPLRLSCPSTLQRWGCRPASQIRLSVSRTRLRLAHPISGWPGRLLIRPIKHEPTASG